MTVTLRGGPLDGQRRNVLERSPGAVFELDGHQYEVVQGPGVYPSMEGHYVGGKPAPIPGKGINVAPSRARV